MVSIGRLVILWERRCGGLLQKRMDARDHLCGTWMQTLEQQQIVEELFDRQIHQWIGRGLLA